MGCAGVFTQPRPKADPTALTSNADRSCTVTDGNNTTSSLFLVCRVYLGEETKTMLKILAATALSIGLATSAMAQSSGGNSGSGGNNGSGNSGSSSGSSDSSGNSGSSNSGGNQGGDQGSSNTNCGAPGGTQGAAQSEQNNNQSTNPGAGQAGTSC